MADQEITELNPLTTRALSDLVPVEHDPSGTPETVKMTIKDFLREAATELTIASDAITLTQLNHKLQPQSGTSDDLSTINGTTAGQTGVLYASDYGTDTITIKHNVGNILCMGGSDISLSYGCAFWYSDGTKVFISGGGGGGQGWTSVSESWSYASASTITIPTGGASRYKQGVKIRFKQGGSYKYYVGRIIADTLVTVVVNTDYTVANSAITDIAISYLDRPDGFPTSFNFTCNLTASTTNPTNITTTANYVVYSWGIECFVSSVAAASPTNGSGYYRWEVPFQSSKSNIAGPLHVSDDNVGRYTGSVVQNSTVGSGGRVLGVVSAGLVSNGVPIATVAVNDSYDFSVKLLW